MANEKKDQSVLSHIGQLVKEEERLYGKSSLTGDDQVRLGELKVELDRCWDLLRQRRALREFGDDPGEAKVRRQRLSRITNSSALRKLLVMRGTNIFLASAGLASISGNVGFDCHKPQKPQDYTFSTGC
jgi:Protein of unknown function (DUF2630)